MNSGRIRKSAWIVIVIVVSVLFVLGVTGCDSAPKYKVDFDGQEMLYEGVKASYRAGEEVTLYFTFVATDTDYSFYLDGETLNTVDYDDAKGFIIHFTMPEHDVKLVCESKNSMEYVPEIEPNVLVFDYYYASEAEVDGGGHYEITLLTGSDTIMIYLDEYVKESDEAEEINKCYFVPYEVLLECMAVVDEYEMYNWNDRGDTIGMDGAVTVCKFMYQDEMIRVSTDAMPENGEEAFNKIRQILTGYMHEDDRVK